MGTSIVFVDSRVQSSLTSALPLSPDTTIVVLDADSDGVAQIARYLDGRTGVASVHVISHGVAGAVYLGDAELNADTLAGYADQLRAIGRSVTSSGDLLFYGCNVAAGDAGAALLERIAALTGADVAASTDFTGAAALGGDWQLEASTGSIEASVLSADTWAGLLAPNTAPTFSVGSGKVSTNIGFTDFGQGMALQADGKIVLAGPTGNDFGVARYTTTGALDATFAGDGTTTTDFHTNADFAQAVQVQSDGMIVVVGHGFNGSTEDFALARYAANGTLDTTFDGDGKVLTDFSPGTPDFGQAAAIQADGKILVAGSSNSDIALARYNTNGSLDTTFGQNLDGVGGRDGMLRTSLALLENGESARAVAVQSDGKILVAGYRFSSMSDSDFALLRYTADGTLDTTFDGDGIVTTSFGAGIDQGFAMAVQSDGKILVAGSGAGATTDFALARYTTTGALDTTFDGDGLVLTDFGGNDVGQALALQSDGRIVLAGYSNNDVAVARYNTDGSLDAGFNSDGRVTTDFQGGSFDRGHAVAVQSDGKIVVGGRAGNGPDSDFGLVRYNGDGSLDALFGPASNTLNGAPSYTEGGAPVVLDSDVRVFDAELGAQGHYAGARLTLARHGGANAQDLYSAAGSALGALTQGGALTYDGVTVGSVTTNSGGTLRLTFNSNATQFRVDGVLEAIAYSNSSTTPPGTVQIDWTFSDGNAGAQGTGGPLTGTGSTTVSVTNIIEGTNGPDTLSGDENRNILRGLGGNDYLLGRGGTDTLEGGSGDDRLEGGADADRLDGGAGFDYARYTSATGVTVDLAIPGFSTGEAQGDTFVSIEGVVGSPGADQLLGNDGDNDLAGFNGDDTILGREGHDNLQGGNGNDVLEGGAGPDYLQGGSGNDRASYENADDGVIADLLTRAANTGEAQSDRYASIEGLVGSLFGDQLFGDNGVNTLTGLDGDDYLNARGGSDTLDGGTGSDFLDGGGGADALIGGDDFDYARYSRATAAVTVDLEQPALNTGDASGDTFDSIEGVIGSAFDDTLSGNDGVNDLVGLAGNDHLFGHADHDTLSGGDGNDVLDGGAGPDLLKGDAGFDIATYADASGGVIVDLVDHAVNTGEAQSDVHMSIEGLTGSAFSDQLFGDAAANTLAGGAGSDYLFGRGGDDTLQGDAANDYLEGGAGADALVGGAGVDYAKYSFATAGVVVDFITPALNTGDALGDTFSSIEGMIGSDLGDQLFGDNSVNDFAGLAGDDMIFGRGGADNLQGMAGDDRLDGGGGADRLNGGAGNDTFVFTRGEADGDTVVDFAGNGAAAGDQLRFQGYGTTGASFIQADATHWTINSADGTAHEVIELLNAASVHPTDFTFV